VATSQAPAPAAISRQPCRLTNLRLDKDNPRFGFPGGQQAEQQDILDRIVEKFGVDDMLSSLAVNGYFEAEPMICRPGPDEKTFIVAEGNRRLAACLILVNDPRAAKHQARGEQYRAIWVAHGQPSIDPVPITVFANDGQHGLLSYLGVRHISSSQPWDSYAKAAWVARVVEEQKLSIAEVALMIGDQHRTIQRLVEGYYFVHQAEAAGQFRPADSVRRGRGSVTDYPFSWVYTLLGYSTARTFLGMDEPGTDLKHPVAAAKISNAGLITRAMFGDRATGKNAAIEDSREIGELAAALADQDKVTLLESGRNLAEISRITQPIGSRLRTGLIEIREIQRDIIAGITEQPLDRDTAEPLAELATRNQRTAGSIADQIRKAAAGDGEGE
jgi:hypothetical protein